MRDEFGKKIVFEAGRRRLHPAQLSCAAEQVGCDLSKEGVGVDDFRQRSGGIAGIDDPHYSRGSDNLFKPLGIDGGMNDEFEVGQRGAIHFKALESCGTNPEPEEAQNEVDEARRAQRGKDAVP